MSKLVVSVDVGGTIAQAGGPSLATVLARLSPLDADEVRRVVRRMLYPQPSVGPSQAAAICAALRIPVGAFPSSVQPSPLRLVPGAVTALRQMSRYATLVTLSNVTSQEADTELLDHLLRPWVKDHFPSCRIGYAKPDPSAFRYVASACRTRETHMVHIGDDWDCDIIGARSAGVTAVWLSNGRPVPEPDRLVDQGLYLAADLAAASRHVTDLALRRRS
jgi:FMN phosphatase YigB (HAD superfamily)